MVAGGHRPSDVELIATRKNARLIDRFLNTHAVVEDVSHDLDLAETAGNGHR